LHWLNWAAVVTLFLGAAFLFKYAIDNNMIGPGMRVLLGLLSGLVLIAAGHFLTKRNQRVFAQGILGLGLAILYLSFYAASSLYQIVAPGVAFGLMSVVTIAAGLLSLYYDAQVMVLLGMIGGYLTPIALSTGEDHPWILFSYLFLLNLGGLAVARRRPWKLVEPLAFLATISIYVGWAATKANPESRPVATVWALAFYAEFAAASERAVWWGAQLLAPITLGVAWDRPTSFLPYNFLLAGGGLVVGEWRKWKEGAPWTLLCFWLPMWAWIGMSGHTGENREADARFLTVTMLLFLMWIVGWIRIGKRPAHWGDMTALIANAWVYFPAAYWFLDPDHHAWMGLFAVMLGGLHVLASALLWKSNPMEESETYPGLLAAGVALAFLTVAIPIQFTGFVITVAWAIEALGITWVWTKFQKTGTAVVAIVLFSMALLRLLSVDLTTYTSSDFRAFVNPRFFAFVVTAVCLWIAAAFAKKGRIAGAGYITGHVVMLVILGIELAGVVTRNWTPEDRQSVFTVALSILMAVYAVCLVILGVALRGAIHRILGLILASLVILKLYLVDVWVLGRGFRIAAFLGLGALLLALSYLYSRFRPSVQKLWKDDAA
jgi:uncharacterized membrane protein